MHYAALLRAVNLAGRNMISMRDLTALLAELGLRDGRSLLQSGNLVFRDERRSAAQLERLLERAVRDRLALATDILVRDANDLARVIEDNPFPKEARQDPGRLVVTFLREAPPADTVRELQDANPGPEVVELIGRHLYIYFPNGMGRSRLSSGLTEKKLGTRGTGRNWNTVMKLAKATGVG